MKHSFLFALMAVVLWSCGGSSSDTPDPQPQENSAPSIPVPSSPENNLLCIDNEVTFEWSKATDPDGDAVSYVLEISENTGFSPLMHSVSVSSNKTTVSLENGVAYYWRVKAVDTKNASSAFGAAFQFYTEGEGLVNHLPFTPSLVNPAVNSVETNASAILEWSSSDVDGEDVLTYDVYFGTENPPAAIAGEALTDSKLEVDLNASQTYYWKVVVKDGAGGAAVSPVWFFKTD